MEEPMELCIVPEGLKLREETRHVKGETESKLGKLGGMRASRSEEPGWGWSLCYLLSYLSGHVFHLQSRAFPIPQGYCGDQRRGV